MNNLGFLYSAKNEFGKVKKAEEESFSIYK
jgi:hypothetical protein